MVQLSFVPLNKMAALARLNFSAVGTTKNIANLIRNNLRISSSALHQVLKATYISQF